MFKRLKALFRGSYGDPSAGAMALVGITAMPVVFFVTVLI